MEAKCRKCENYFDKSEIIVVQEGIFCKDCLPPDHTPMPFTLHISWRGITALMDYIDGSGDLETLEVIEKIRHRLGVKVIEQIRRILHGEVRESDS